MFIGSFIRIHTLFELLKLNFCRNWWREETENIGYIFTSASPIPHLYPHYTTRVRKLEHCRFITPIFKVREVKTFLCATSKYRSSKVNILHGVVGSKPAQTGQWPGPRAARLLGGGLFSDRPPRDASGLRLKPWGDTAPLHPRLSPSARALFVLR